MVLAVECEKSGADGLRFSLCEVLTAAGINASVGLAIRDGAELVKAVQTGDLEMYKDKIRHRNQRAEKRLELA